MDACRTAHERRPWCMLLLLLNDCRNLYVRHDRTRLPPTEGFRPPAAARSATQDAAEVKLYGLRERDFFASSEFASRRDSMDVMSLTSLCPKVGALSIVSNELLLPGGRSRRGPKTFQ